ncbi:hypothetical protein [Variovorax sp. dw_954]|uniref:hypothetical protein n=1 Tax=Variovorax sp. dw_954 TaxID=2720078 RepID=UPI001BD5E736|nr:hypothetical protein [Variovorax sp. dw_954]
MSKQISRGDKYVLRFEHPGHRERVKQMAAVQKRSLNKQILTLIEGGEETPTLRVALDRISDHAAQCLEWIKVSEDRVPPDMRPMVAGVVGMLKQIGFTADSTDSDAGADLHELWGLTQ